jgi:hypothetical protein
MKTPIEGKPKKKPNRNSGTAKYNNWNEKFTGKIQRQISAGRKGESDNLQIRQKKQSSLRNIRKQHIRKTEQSIRVWAISSREATYTLWDS